MMFGQIAGWILLALAGAFVVLVVVVFQYFRATSNKLLAVASKEFHEAGNSLMESATELPDSVLTALSVLNHSAFARKTPWTLYTALKHARSNGAGSSGTEGELSAFDQVADLRPDLRKLFATAVASWLNILTHRSVILHFLIANEVTRMQAMSGTVAKGQDNEGAFKSLIPALRHVDC